MPKKRIARWSLGRMLVAGAVAGATVAVAAGCGTPVAEPGKVPQGPPPPEQPKLLGEFVPEDSPETKDGKDRKVVAAPAGKDPEGEEAAETQGDAESAVAAEQAGAEPDDADGDDSGEAEDASAEEPAAQEPADP